MLADPFFVRNLVYGLEDSFISTTGMLAGVAFAGMPLPYIVMSGIVLITVEALSMAFGAFVSEESFMIASKKSYKTAQVFLYAFTMFVSYVVAGLIVLAPYVLALQHHYAYSIGLAIVCLFGIVYGLQRDLAKAILMTVVGSAILAITIFVGRVLENKNMLYKLS